MLSVESGETMSVVKHKIEVARTEGGRREGMRPLVSMRSDPSLGERTAETRPIARMSLLHIHWPSQPNAIGPIQREEDRTEE